MRNKKVVWLIALLLTVMGAVSGCSLRPPTADAPALDPAELVRNAVATVQAAQAGQSSPTAEVDAETIRAAVDAAVQERLAQIPSEELARLVEEAVAARLAQIESRVAVSQPSAALAAGDGDLQATLIELYRRANPSVVYIVTVASSGSGFVYDADGHIVTNRHVVANSRGYEVVFADGERAAARLVGADVDSDLAVLKVDALPAGVQPLPLAEPDSVQVGQFVVAIGNPFGEQGSMSVGIVSGLGRSLRSQRALSGSGAAYSLPGVIQTDAPINPGNSGGPLLDLAGRVVGVNSAIASTTGVNSGVGFAIPVAAVHRIVPSLIERGSYTYSYMGVSFDDEISLSEQRQYGLERTQGAYVLAVTAGSPADRAGLRAADPTTGRGGDLVIAIDGRPVRNFNDMNAYLVFNTEPGQTIQLTVLRDGQEVTLSLTLGARP